MLRQMRNPQDPAIDALDGAIGEHTDFDIDVQA